MERYTKFWCLVFLVSSFGETGLAENTDQSSYYLTFGDEDFVSIATGQKQHISEAPAVASVVTKEDIHAIGATTLAEVLETVPGLHVSVSASAYNPIFIVRGIYSEFNPHILFLINGIPITNVFVGDRGQVWGEMPVESIERIEVIRGPGSAIFGADAFSGVVNIITKDANYREDGFGFRAGSFDSTDVWTTITEDWFGFDTALTLEYGETDGQSEVVQEDFQTTFDSIFGTDASYAPSGVNTGLKRADMRLDALRGNWNFRLGYQGRREVGLGAGLAQALDPVGFVEVDRTNADLTYSNSDFLDNWDFTTQISWFKSKQDTDIYLFPDETVLPIGGDGNIATPGGGIVYFPDGVRAGPGVTEEHRRIKSDIFYSGFNDHVMRLGIGYNSIVLESEETKNYGPGVIDGTEGVVDGTLTDVSGTEYIFMEDNNRYLSYVFVQDEWSFAPDWGLTAGVRYDNYSDFGDTINPRLALVWQKSRNLTAKMLYGRAFRAPSFAEQFNINNPILRGNPSLEPEKIDTLELVLDYSSLGDKIRTSLNMFVYEMRDIIRFIPDPSPATTITAQNFGKQEGHGIEIEFQWDVVKAFRIQGNYAWQDSEDQVNNADIAHAPGQQVYLRGDWVVTESTSMNMQINHVADRKRETSDPRPDVDDYTTVDVTLRYSPSRNNSEFSVSIKNLFDDDAREPSRAPGNIPGDLPLAGRHGYIEYRYFWN